MSDVDQIRARGQAFLARMHGYIGANESRIYHWRAMAYTVKSNPKAYWIERDQTPSLSFAVRLMMHRYHSIGRDFVIGSLQPIIRFEDIP